MRYEQNLISFSSKTKSRLKAKSFIFPDSFSAAFSCSASDYKESLNTEIIFLLC